MTMQLSIFGQYEILFSKKSWASIHRKIIYILIFKKNYKSYYNNLKNPGTE